MNKVKLFILLFISLIALSVAVFAYLATYSPSARCLRENYGMSYTPGVTRVDYTVCYELWP